MFAFKTLQKINSKPCMVITPRNHDYLPAEQLTILLFDICTNRVTHLLTLKKKNLIHDKQTNLLKRYT